MIALSIRQPWAWLILHGWKDIENRDWTTRFRGRVLVHAAKGMTLPEYFNCRDLAAELGVPVFPEPEQLPRGGIVGSVEITACVTDSASPWFVGRYGFMLRDPLPLPFVPWRGQLGFFEVPDDALQAGAVTA